MENASRSADFDGVAPWRPISEKKSILPVNGMVMIKIIKNTKISR
jgi:hypothetical protein